MEAGQENQASRNLRQLRDEVEWRRLEGEVNSLEAQRREAAPPPAAQEPTVPAGAFRFRLEAVTHTPSAILSDEEFTRVTAPFVGRDVAIADLKAMLEAVNALYREKGYVVCEARLAPQRIRGGRLLVTLVEGRTGCTTVSGAWQAVIDGDPLSSSQYFYLGHTSGVRGYDNDVLSAEAGAYVNFEASWAPAGPRTALFAFLDAGRLTGTSSYSRRELASTGLGATWPLWKGASVTATAGFPLIRNLGAGERAGKARFDLAVTASW